MSDVAARAEASAPPEAPALLYRGAVMHARLRPRPHRFRYRVFSLLIDIDRLDEAARMSRLFSVGRFNLAGFDPADHGLRSGRPLRQEIDEMLAEAGLAAPARRVLLLCYPRILGFVFNPLSVYFAYGREDDLLALVYEVRNTFGERHSYVAPVAAGELDRTGVRQVRAKRFFVSPFMTLDQQYRFRIEPPGERVTIHILSSDAEGPLFAAGFHGSGRVLSTGALLSSLTSMPFMTLKVVAAIGFEALRLRIKGLRTYRRTPAAPLASFGDSEPEGRA